MVFNEDYDVDEILAELTLMIAEPANTWVLPFLYKQFEAFTLLKQCTNDHSNGSVRHIS